MDKKRLASIIIALFLPAVALAGAAVIFNGSDVETLKQNINLHNIARIVTGTADPSVSATDGNQGSVYLRTGASGGSVYVKQDSGSTTNWTQLATSASAPSAISVLTKTADYTVLTTDFNSSKKLLLECNCTTACTMTLPAATNTGYDIKVKNIGTASCTVAGAGTDTLDSNATFTEANQYDGYEFIANGGAQWDVF